MDNFGATRILTIGSSKPLLHDIAIDIFFHCMKYNIKLQPEWIPRELNCDADYYSKIHDSDSWGVDRNTFDFISSQFGPFSVDRFADDRKKLLPTFNYRYYCPGTSHVNSFTADWSHDNNWLCPPVSLVGSTLRQLGLCKARGTLLVPYWESSYFWPLLRPTGKHFAPFVRNYLIVHPYYENYGNDTAFQGYATFPTIALQLQF